MSVIAHQESLQQRECLQQIAQQLQTCLLSWSQTMPFQVQCVLYKGNLMVLSQHPPGERPEVTPIFECLERALKALPELMQTLFHENNSLQGVQAKLYLRMLGQRQPYAYHEISLAATDSQSTIEPLLLNEAQSGSTITDVHGQIEGVLDREGFGVEPESPLGLSYHPEPESQHLELDDSFFADAPSAETDTASTAEAAIAAEPPETHREASLLPWIIAGIGVSVVSFAAGLLVVSHTCVIGRCEPLQMAETLNQEGSHMIKTAKSGNDLGQAQQRLNQANRLLSSVPPWSTHRNEAQLLLVANQAELALLERALLAEKRAGEAMQKSQTFPQGVSRWQSTQSLWRDGISQLETIAQGTSLYPFAQQRLVIYRTNVATINRYIAAEQQAQKKLTRAKATASTAAAQQGIAQTLENWQQVQLTWQDVVSTLQQIPNTTTSFAEAQQRLNEYQPKLATTRDRVTQELTAQSAYSQATKLAQKAETLQRQNQWTQAVKTWRDAFSQAKRVPPNSTYYNRAQALIDPYAIALQRAESQLQVVVASQRLRGDLNRVCGGSPKTCTFLILSNSIRVQFTPAYEQALKQAFSAGQTGNNQVLGGTVNHLDTLQAALQTISTNSGVPLEVYNAAGTEVVGSFNPGG